MIRYNVHYNVGPAVQGQFPLRCERDVPHERLDALARDGAILDGATATPIGTNDPGYLRLTTTRINPTGREWVLVRPASKAD